MLILLQAAAVLLTAGSWLPQWWRAAHCDARGVSVGAWSQAAVLGGTWGMWGARAHVWSVALSEGAFAAGCLVILGSVLPRRRFAVCALCALVAALAGALWLPAVCLSVGGLLGSTSMRGAQAAKMLRTRSAAGVSTATWILLGCSGTAWGVVGWCTGKWPLVVGALLGLAGTALLAAIAARVGAAPAS